MSSWDEVRARMDLDESKVAAHRDGMIDLRRALDDSKAIIAALLAKHCNGRAVLTDEDMATVERGRLSVRSDPLHGTLLLTYEPGA